MNILFTSIFATHVSSLTRPDASRATVALVKLHACFAHTTLLASDRASPFLSRLTCSVNVPWWGHYLVKQLATVLLPDYDV